MLASGEVGSEPPGQVVDAQAVESQAVESQAVESALRWGEPVVAAQAVPAGRIPFDLSGEAVLCYTVISGEALRVLHRVGSVRPEPVKFGGDQAMDDSFAAAYDWMRWQLHRHIQGYAGGFPIWVWARTSRRDLVSTVDDLAGQSPGSALLTLRIPRDRLLLTDYLTWHDVLNGSPTVPIECVGCGTSHCDDAGCFDRWFDSWYDRWTAQIPQDEDGTQLPWWCWPPHLQARLFDSWEAVRSLQRGSLVQGCVEQLREEWVQALSALRVTSRRKVSRRRARSSGGPSDE